VLLGVALLTAAPGCNRDDDPAKAGEAKRPSLEQALAEARARAPNRGDTVEAQAKILLANLHMARRQMVQTTDGEAERLPNEVVKLAHMGRSIVPLVTPELADPVPDTRYFMMEVLAEVGDHREQDEFIHALGDSDAGVVRVASEAIGRHRDAETVPVLFQALEEDRIRQIRWGPILTPPKPFDHDLVPYLIRRLADQRPDIRISASIALNRVTGEDLGFDPSGDEDNRRRAVMRWESWWTETGRTKLPEPAAPPKPATPGAPPPPHA